MLTCVLIRVTLTQLIKLLSCDCKVTDSSPRNSLLYKKYDKVAYNTLNSGTLFRTLLMRELQCTRLPFFMLTCVLMAHIKQPKKSNFTLENIICKHLRN